MTMTNNRENLDPWYVTGLCEGEGTFTYQTSYQNRKEIIFGVKLAHTEGYLLESLQKFFNAGRIYKVKPIAPKNHSGYTKSALYYKVFSLSDLEKIVAHFDTYTLRGEKLKRYTIWREMFLLKKKNHLKRRYPEIDRKKVGELARRLSDLAPKNVPWDGETTSPNK